MAARVLTLSLLAYLILASYEVARPAVESLFLGAHGHEALPTAWLLVALGATAAVALYARFAARVRLDRLLAACAVLSGCGLALLQLARGLGLPGWAYGMYVWKDVYVVIVLELFWTYANAVQPLRAARWSYGLFCAAGSAGAITGDRIVSLVAPRIGTETTLWLALVPLALVVVVAAVLGRQHRDLPALAPTGRGLPGRAELRQGLRTLRQSPYLGLILWLIITIQLVITLVDYQFNAFVEVAYPSQDLRTAAIGRVYEIINYGSLVLQLLTGPILRALGVATALVVVPVLVGSAVIGLALVPGFLGAAVAKVAGKCFDYSVYRAAKEMLYIPLSYRDKTQGKAFIDMLGYRAAKGGVAIMLHALIALGAAAALGWMAVGWTLVWVGLAVVIARRYRRHLRAGGEG